MRLPESLGKTPVWGVKTIDVEVCTLPVVVAVDRVKATLEI